jgi:hypothetical protein
MNRLFLILIASTLYFTAPAQIVNIESQRMHSDTVGWLGSVGSTFSLVKNTQQILSLNANAHLQYKTQKDLYLFLASYDLLKASSSDLSNNTFIHLRYNRKLNKWLTWEVFTQLQQNAVTGIDLRSLAGTGPRFKIYKTNKLHLYAGMAAMYEYEREAVKPPVIHKDVRSSNYFSFTYMPSSIFNLVFTTFYQPLFSNFSDYRIFNETILNIKATKHFSIITAFNYLYDAFPVQGVPKVNYTISNGFSYTF